MVFAVFQLLLLIGFHVTWCKTRSEIVRELFDENYYDHQTRPGEDRSRSPTRVELTVFVRAVSEVDTKKMQMKMQITLRQKWMDQRLGYSAYNFPVRNTLCMFDQIKMTNDKNNLVSSHRLLLVCSHILQISVVRMNIINIKLAELQLYQLGHDPKDLETKLGN